MRGFSHYHKHFQTFLTVRPHLASLGKNSMGPTTPPSVAKYVLEAVVSQPELKLGTNASTSPGRSAGRTGPSNLRVSTHAGDKSVGEGGEDEAFDVRAIVLGIVARHARRAAEPFHFAVAWGAESRCVSKCWASRRRMVTGQCCYVVLGGSGASRSAKFRASLFTQHAIRFLLPLLPPLQSPPSTSLLCAEIFPPLQGAFTLTSHLTAAGSRPLGSSSSLPTGFLASSPLGM